MENQISPSGPIAVVLPTCHGKSTLHNLRLPGVYDAGELVPDKSALRELRKESRVTNDWIVFDEYWSKQIKRELPPDSLVLMVPCNEIALQVGIPVRATIVLDYACFCETLTTRVKSGAYNAIANYEQEVKRADNVIMAEDHEHVRRIIIGIARTRCEETGRECPGELI